MTVDEIATQLGLTDNAVRLHLSTLERDGLVHVEGVRRGALGKPATLYAVTARVDATLSRAIEPVLDALVTVLESRDDSPELQSTLRATGRELASRLPTPEGALEDRARSAVDVIRQLGGDATLEATGDGVALQGHGCPIGTLVARHPDACLVLESFLGELVGADVHTECAREGRPRCRFDVRDRATPPRSEG